MPNYTVLKGEAGVLTTPGADPTYAAALLSNEAGDEVVIATPDGMEPMEVSRIDQDGNSDRLVLVTNKAKYNWRPLREADGIWMSKLGVPLPVEALPGIASTGDTVDDSELLSAYSSGDSPYVLGAVYETADGGWSRNGGQWIPMAGDDTTYADMDRIEIDPDRAKEFLDLYDKNYVTVSDASGFESQPAE